MIEVLNLTKEKTILKILRMKKNNPTAVNKNSKFTGSACFCLNG